MYRNIRAGPALHRIWRFSLDNEEHHTVPPGVLMDILRLLMTNNVFQFGIHPLVTESGNSDGSATSSPLGHDLLRRPWRGSALSVWTQAPTTLSFYWQCPRYLDGWSRPSRRSHKMDGIQIAHARLIQFRMDLRRILGHSELYGHDDLNPRRLDCHIALWKGNATIFIHPAPFHPSPGSVNRTCVW